jgi:hypothetical protein
VKWQTNIADLNVNDEENYANIGIRSVVLGKEKKNIKKNVCFRLSAHLI